MTFHLDHHYRMGATHHVCQDYALHGHEPAPFVIVADGCSSVADSDVGARILSYMARKVFWHQFSRQPGAPPLEYRNFGERTIAGARIITEALGISTEVLHSTLMLACVKERHAHVYIYGDGCVLLLGQAGQVNWIDIEFVNNMPFYLNYWQESAHQDAFAEAVNRGAALEISYSGQDKPELRKFQDPIYFNFDLGEYAAVALVSDGCTQFLHTGEQRKLEMDEVAARLLSFEHRRENFVLSHLSLILQEYAKAGIYPLDDVALAVIAHSDGP